MAVSVTQLILKTQTILAWCLQRHLYNWPHIKLIHAQNRFNGLSWLAIKGF